MGAACCGCGAAGGWFGFTPETAVGRKGSVIQEMAGCLGKAKFESFGVARQRAEKKRDGLAARIAYRCRFCGKVHIGERDVAKERALRQIRREIEMERETDDALD